MALGYDGKLYILAFDHRGSFQKKMFGIQGDPTDEETRRIADAKHLIYEGMVKAVEVRTVRSPSRCSSSYRSISSWPPLQFWTLVTPSRLASRIPSTSAAFFFSFDGFGTTRSTRDDAPSLSVPVGAPVFGSLTISPWLLWSCGVFAVRPAAFRAALLHQAEWPSYE